jgi:hypothetical protein
MLSQNQNIKKYFSLKPSQLYLFNIIYDRCIDIGPIKIKVSKTQISFANRRQFAWIWLPLPWDKRRPPHSIVLSFALPKQISDKKIVKAIQPYPGRWMHHMIIENGNNVNSKVCKWLKQAYIFGQ